MYTRRSEDELPLINTPIFRIIQSKPTPFFICNQRPQVVTRRTKICFLCQAIFSCQNKIQIHFEEVHKEWRLKCPLVKCDKQYLTYKAFKKHIQTHGNKVWHEYKAERKLRKEGHDHMDRHLLVSENYAMKMWNKNTIEQDVEYVAPDDNNKKSRKRASKKQKLNANPEIRKEEFNLSDLSDMSEY